MNSLGSIRRSFAPWDDPDAKPYIQFDRVTKTFGDFAAVNDLSLAIYEREFFALLGASAGIAIWSNHICAPSFGIA